VLFLFIADASYEADGRSSTVTVHTMKRVAVLLGAMLALLPSIMYLADLRYRFDPALQHSVCRSLVCSDRLLLDSADRLAEGGDPQSMTAVLALLQEALRRNPASPDRWCDLGEALFAAGRIPEAQYCFTRAVALGPQSPPAFWRTAQFYMRIHETSRSQEYMSRMLSLLPQYRDLVFNVYLSSGANIVDTLKRGFPNDSRFAADYFRYLLTHGIALEDSRKAWDWLQNHSTDDGRLAGDYVDWLIKRGDYVVAGDIWKRSAGKNDRAYFNPNLVFNGSFETAPLQSGLDWRYIETPGVHVMRDSSFSVSGSSSLEMEFDGTANIDFNSITHDVVAAPGRYHFKAWVRTSELTTDQGIGFHLADSSGQLNLETITMSGTHDWTPVDLDFTLSGPVRLLRIEIVRKRSWKFDNKISGKAWIDDVSLVRS
jgi:hypothetical protein